MQQQPLDDPIPRSIWRDIIQDRFVNFEKLFASMDRGYDHHDEPRSFHGEFALVRKDQFVLKKPLLTEAQWIRVFSSWSKGVVLVYAHREQELEAYKRFVMDLFRAIPQNPAMAIAFDVEARDRYSKTPYLMDDRLQLNSPLIAVQFHSSPSAASSKRLIGPPAATTTKRSKIICENWNADRCSDPCINSRRHGECCECGGKHRAIDSSDCIPAFQVRRSRRMSSSVREGGSRSLGPNKAHAAPEAQGR